MAKKQQKKQPKKQEKPAKQGFKLTETQLSIAQHAGIILVFFLIVYGFFNPLFNGHQLDWHDIKHYTGMAQESLEFKQETGEEALWVSTLFSGMPAYQTYINYPGNWFWNIDKLLWFGLPRPANYIFLAFLGFFFLLRTLKLSPWLSGIGAAAFALSSYHFIILIPGHTSKANAIAYMAPVIAGVLMAYRGKLLLGGAITAFFFALQVNANHYQITYFLALMLISMGIVFAVHAIREKQIPDFLKASGVLVLAGLLGVIPNSGKLMTTSEYAEATIRGKAELAAEKQDKDSGLSFDYAMSYSEGVWESFTLMIPNFHGGPTIVPAKTPEDMKVAGRMPDGRAVTSPYWGNQGSTSGPSYAGAIICFLFVLGLILVPGKLKWWLLAISVFGLMLSWGRNFLPFAELCFSYLPGYKMFRAPTMYLVILELTLPLLGILGVQQLLSDQVDKEAKLKALYIAAGVVGGLCLLFGLLGGSLFSFAKDGETPAAAIVAYRKGRFVADAFRSAGFILGAAAALWLYLQGRIKHVATYAILAALIVMDLLIVNARYYEDDSYIRDREVKQIYDPTPADQFILQDTDPNYRVLNAVPQDGSFNDAITSYHHKSIGGYHAAKLRRYNDVISNYIELERRMLIQAIQAAQQQLQSNQVQDQAVANATILGAIQNALPNLRTMNMLNTRYIILNPNGQPIDNSQNAMGNAWLVQSIQQVENPDEELNSLRSTNLRTTAVVDKNIYEGAFAQQLEGFRYQADPNANITFTSSPYSPKHLTYSFSSTTEQVAIFSEIYYNSGKGWNAYIDGELVPHFRANYILRGLRIPAGTHMIEFKFEPQTYYTWDRVGMIGSILCLLFFLGALGWENKEWLQSLLNRGKTESDA